MRPAFANGRFPLAQQVVVVPGSGGQKLVLRSTFGLLVSEDGGKSFRWACEQTFGYSGAWDPPIAFTKDGTLYVGLENGLATTKDFCQVTRVPALEGETVKDLSVDSAGTVLVVTTTAQKPSALYRKPEGKPFERVGKGLENMYLVTVDAAPGKPSRVYVTGQPKGTLLGRFFRSDDGGAHFVELDQKRSHKGAYFIVGVDPKDPSRVVSRFLHFEGSEITLSEDSGKTNRTVMSIPSAMYGASMSPDGSRFWAASGLATDGLWASDDRGRTFAKVAEVGAQCLTATDTLLYQCTNPFDVGGPALGVSSDLGKTFRPVASFGAVEAPIACSGAAKDTCQKPFVDLGTQLAPWKDAGADAAPESGDASVEAGSGEAGVDASLSGREVQSKRGCGCSASGDSTIHGGAIPLVVWALSRVRRRRSSALHGRKRSIAPVHEAPPDTSCGSGFCGCSSRPTGLNRCPTAQKVP